MRFSKRAERNMEMYTKLRRETWTKKLGRSSRKQQQILRV